MQLKEYLIRKNMRQIELCRLTGIALSHISLYCHKKIVPSLEHLQKIIKATSGEVGIDDFVDENGRRL